MSNATLEKPAAADAIEQVWDGPTRQEAHGPDRSKYIGSVDIAAILGLHPHRTPRQVYEQKVGISTTETNEDMVRGTSMEPVCKAVYEYATGMELVKSPFRMLNGYPFLGDTCDFEVWTDGEIDRCIEFKTHDYPFAREDYGPDLSDQVPDHELIQCQWHMMHAGASLCELAVWFGLRKWNRFIIVHDPDWCAEMRDFAVEWWEKHVKGDTPPPLTGSMVDAEYVKRRFPKGREELAAYATPEIEALIEEHREAKRIMKLAETDETGLANKIKDFMGDASVLHFSGATKPITWRNNKDSQKIDWQAVAMALSAPIELIQQHTTIKPGARVLRCPYSRE